MAMDLTPDAWIASMSEDATNITIPIASITGLTAAQADAATGDIREFLFKLLNTIQTAYAALAVADRPGQMSIGKTPTIIDADSYRTSFVVTFNRDISTSAATAEA